MIGDGIDEPSLRSLLLAQAWICWEFEVEFARCQLPSEWG